jgi:hypothetical protein
MYQGEESPLVVFGEEDEGFVGLPELTGLDEARLASEYGYSKEAATEALSVLKTIHVSQGIEAEYEKEKAEFEKKTQPVLARSASHELGGAEGSGDTTSSSPTVMVTDIFDMVKTMISDTLLD